MTLANLPRPPQRDELVFHYTNVAGFLGICESKSLWASDVRLLNDYLEVGYFFDRVRGFLRHRPSTDGVADLMDKSSPPYGWQFVACFSEKRDMLSQWRAYTGAQGFSVGFLRTHLEETARKNGYDFRPVNYNTDIAEQRISEIIELGLSSSEYATWKNAPTDVGSRQSCAGVFTRLLLEEAVFHKHPSFEEEGEWRLCKQIIRLDDGIRYRANSRGIVPYLEFPLDPLKPVLEHAPTNYALEVMLYPGGISNAQFDAAWMASTASGFCGGVHRSSCPVVTS